MFSTFRSGGDPGCQYGIIQLGVGQEDGRRGAVFEHLTARYNAGRRRVQANLPDWAIFRLDQSRDVLPRG